MRPPTKGPRSLMRTTTERPLPTWVTRTRVPNGSERWAAVRRAGVEARAGRGAASMKSASVVGRHAGDVGAARTACTAARRPGAWSSGYGAAWRRGRFQLRSIHARTARWSHVVVIVERGAGEMQMRARTCPLGAGCAQLAAGRCLCQRSSPGKGQCGQDRCEE